MDYYYHASGHITLHSNPVQPMHAVTKAYVESAIKPVNGSDFVEGIVPAYMIPTLEGDLQVHEGTTEVSLKDVLSLPGVYTVVQVDASGRVVANGITEDDINRVSWNDILNKPTTLRGYGIVDAVSTAEGFSIEQVVGVQTTEPEMDSTLTKAFVDEAIANVELTSYEVGDVGILPMETTPVGFLKANGGLVDKVTYAALYAVIGEAFNGGGGHGYMGQPWRQQQAFNTAEPPLDLTWQQDGELLAVLSSSQCAVTNSQAYLLGGSSDGLNTTKSIWSSSIAPDGTIGVWEKHGPYTALTLTANNRTGNVPKEVSVVRVMGKGEDGTIELRELTPEQPYIPPTYNYVWEVVSRVDKVFTTPPTVSTQPSEPPTAAGQTVKTISFFNPITGIGIEETWQSVSKTSGDPLVDPNVTLTWVLEKIAEYYYGFPPTVESTPKVLPSFVDQITTSVAGYNATTGLVTLKNWKAVDQGGGIIGYEWVATTTAVETVATLPTDAYNYPKLGEPHDYLKGHMSYVENNDTPQETWYLLERNIHDYYFPFGPKLIPMLWKRVPTPPELIGTYAWKPYKREYRNGHNFEPETNAPYGIPTTPPSEGLMDYVVRNDLYDIQVKTYFKAVKLGPHIWESVNISKTGGGFINDYNLDMTVITYPARPSVSSYPSETPTQGASAKTVTSYVRGELAGVAEVQRWETQPKFGPSKLVWSEVGQHTYYHTQYPISESPSETPQIVGQTAQTVASFNEVTGYASVKTWKAQTLDGSPVTGPKSLYWSGTSFKQEFFGKPPTVVGKPPTPPTQSGQTAKTITGYDPVTKTITETTWTTTGSPSGFTGLKWEKTTTARETVFDFPTKTYRYPEREPHEYRSEEILYKLYQNTPQEVWYVDSNYWYSPSTGMITPKLWSRIATDPSLVGTYVWRPKGIEFYNGVIGSQVGAPTGTAMPGMIHYEVIHTTAGSSSIEIRVMYSVVQLGAHYWRLIDNTAPGFVNIFDYPFQDRYTGVRPAIQASPSTTPKTAGETTKTVIDYPHGQLAGVATVQNWKAVADYSSSTLAWVKQSDRTYSHLPFPFIATPSTTPTTVGETTTTIISFDDATGNGVSKLWTAVEAELDPGQPYIPPTYEVIKIQGGNNTFTINDQTYTFVGGNGEPAQETVVEIPIPVSQTPTSFTSTIGPTGQIVVRYKDPNSPEALSKQLPQGVMNSQAVLTYKHLYLIGGETSRGVKTSSVYYCRVNDEGDLGVWETDTPLPKAVSHHQCALIGNRVYLFGGSTATRLSNEVYSAVVSSEGTVRQWSSQTTLPVPLSHSQVAVTKSRVYLIGGKTSEGVSAKVFSGSINPDFTIGSWSETGALPVGIATAQVVVTQRWIYLIGGTTATGSSSGVYTAPISEDGVIGAWTVSESLPESREMAQALTTSSKLYLLGGITTTNTPTTVSRAFTGGVNDYLTPILSNNNVLSSQFKLPDYSEKENAGLYYYIKY